MTLFVLFYACIALGLGYLVARLTQKKEADAAALPQLRRRLLELRDDEKSRIARRLHETTAQNLAAARLQLALLQRSAAACDANTAEALQELLALTDQSIAEVRAFSFDLQAPALDEEGLFASLRAYARSFEARTGIVTRLELPEEETPLPREVEVAALRIVQEAWTYIHLNNGGTTDVVIAHESGEVRISIDGLPYGLSGNQNRMPSAGIEFAGVEERARELGGTMKIERKKDAVCVEVILPVLEARDAATASGIGRGRSRRRPS